MTKVAVATQQGGLDDQVSPAFGRCQTYTFVEVEDGEVKGAEVVQNQFANAAGGAGIQAAGLIASQGAEAVISGNVGPNVASVLNQSGVKMVQASGMSVKEAVQDYLNEELQSISQATASAMSGSGRGAGRGMGRRSMQKPGQQPQQQSPRQMSQRSPQQPSQSGQPSGGDRIQKIEERMESLEKDLDEIKKGLKDLKSE